MHEVGCTLEFQLSSYWMALELLVGDGPGVENHAQLRFGMCLVALPARGDHAVPRPIMTIEVSASGCLPHLPFGATGPIGPHDSECTLELQLHLHWMALEMLVRDGPGVENHAKLRFGMCLVALPARGDHAVPRPIMTRWLTRLLEFCNGFHR